MRTPAVLPLALLLCACNASSPPAVPAATGKTAPAAPPSADGVAQRYACAADTIVDVLDDGSARVALPGGRRIELARIANSDPPVFTGSALYFTERPTSTTLSQENGANDLACKPAQAP